MYLTNNPENFNVLEQVLEQSDALFFIYDITPGKFRYISPAFQEIWEQNREDFFQSPEKLLPTIHPEDLPDLQASWALAHHRRKKVQEFRIVCPDGKEKWLRLKPFYVLTDQDQMAVAGFVVDITAIKDHDTTMLKYTAQKNSSLEILSHDLAGPLNIIQQLTNFLLEATQPYHNQDITQDLELIRETCARSVNLIRELVNQEFLESVNAGLKKERLDLVDRINNIVEMYRQSERAISKTFNLAFTNQPIFVEMDEVKFMQVINNLISNSIKFTPEHGVINIFIADEEEQVSITIEDNGIGIPEKFHEVLFDRFTPARRQGLRGEEPVGLGMSIIKRIVEMHHGRIWFESKENKGTDFHIVIPKQQQVKN
jgi:two-component system, OmpR family, sensor histidine kinase VicK